MKTRSALVKPILVVSVAAFSAALLWGCDNSPDMNNDTLRGNADDAVEETRNAASHAAEDTSDAASRAAEATGDAVEDAGDRIERATD